MVSSKDIAEVLGKRDDNLLRAIRKYCEALGGSAESHFIPQGEGKKPTYEVTLAGCELIAGRMVGQAGDTFRAWYKDKFDIPEEVAPVSVVDEKLFTVAEIAEQLGVSERSVYRNIQMGKLEAVEKEILVPTVKKFVTPEALEKFKAEKEGC